MAIDSTLFHLINNWSRLYWPLDWLMIFLAQYSGYFMLVAAVFFFLLLGGHWKTQAYYFAVTALSALFSYGIVAQILKYFVVRPRPFVTFQLQALIAESGNAFPSGHASFFFALACATFLFNRKLGCWFLATALLMGIARVYVGVHYPLDILGGAVIGVLGVCVAVFLIDPKRSKERLRNIAF